MADKPTGEWGTLSFSIPLVDELEPARVAINSVTEFLLAGLNIAVEALNLVKTFTVSYLDPISEIIEAVVDELDALSRSLSDIGLYVAGDWDLLQYPFTDLKGGFSEYERRMIARLTDRTDPTRPDVASEIQTFAGFFYLSVDAAEIERIIAFVEQITRFFNLSFNPKGGMPTPTIKEVVYGTSTTDILSFDTLDNFTQWSDTPPQVARITWQVTPPTTDSPFKPFPGVPPKKYLVAVSTVPDGIHLMYDRPRANTDTRPVANKSRVQPRDYGHVVDRRGTPVVLQGGFPMLQFNESTFGWDKSVDDKGNVLPNKARVYGLPDPAKNSVIPLEKLFYNDNGTFKRLWQDTFFPDEVEASLQWATDEFTLDLPYDSLPWHATVKMVDGKAEITNVHRPTTYYVRVASTGESSINDDGDILFVYDLASDGAKEMATSTGPFFIDVGSPIVRRKSFTISAWSEPEKLTFSNANTKEYLEAVKAALALLVLCRVDLTVIDELNDLKDEGVLSSAKESEIMLPDVALKETGLEGFRHLLDRLYTNFDDLVKTKGTSPETFRKSLLDRVSEVANELYQSTGPMPGAEKAVVDATEKLRTIKWSEIFIARRGENDVTARELAESTYDPTILESLGAPSAGGEDTNRGVLGDWGLALNPWCIGVDEYVITNLQFLSGDDHKVFRERSPHFIELSQSGATGAPVEPFVFPQDVPTFLDKQPSGLRMLYELYVDPEDGSIAVESDTFDWFFVLRNLRRLVGSADRSPVFYSGRSVFTDEPTVLDGNTDISYCRTLLAEYNGGQLMNEARIALGVAAAAHQRSPLDGEWYSVRIGDVIPGISQFIDSLSNWIETLQSSIESVGDTLESYIAYVEARIIETQQLIRRINSLLQTAFSIGFGIPKVSGLVLASNGTDGVLADFANAENKPSDSPLSYGAGVVVVAPAYPSFLVDLFSVTDDPVDEGVMVNQDEIPPIFGIEDIPEEDLNPPSDPEPDVL